MHFFDSFVFFENPLKFDFWNWQNLLRSININKTNCLENFLLLYLVVLTQSLGLSQSLSVCVSLSICCYNFLSVCLPVCPCIFVCMFLSVCLPVCLSDNISVYWFVNLSVSLFACMLACLSVCLSLFACLSVCLFERVVIPLWDLSMNQCVCLSV